MFKFEFGTVTVGILFQLALSRPGKWSTVVL